MKKLSVVLVFFVTALLITFTAAPIAAQVPETTPASPDVRPEWGTAGVSIKQVNAWAFLSASVSNVAFMGLGSRQRYCTAGTCQFTANVDLPSGAQIVALEIDGCDINPNAMIGTGLSKEGRGGGAETKFATAGSSDAFNAGCSTFRTDLTTPETVDNFNNSYFVGVYLGPDPSIGGYVGNHDNTTTFAAIRIYYQLQISSPPATATFNDVPPSHPFFQHIEALYASGITTGCPYPNFCPEMYVTRGQMAAFLARALGLYWPYQ